MGTDRFPLTPGFTQVVVVQKSPQRDLNSCRRRERAKKIEKKDNKLQKDTAEHPLNHN
jgi:hypothetical protein